jgi:hypothetical protein
VLAGAAAPPPPDDAERLRVFRLLLAGNVRARGERWGVQVTRRHLPLLGSRLAPRLRTALVGAASLAATLDVLGTVSTSTTSASAA